MNTFTNLVAAFSVAYLLEKRVLTASIFSVAPDFDSSLNLIYPFTENGIMHSFLASSVAASLVYIYTEDRTSAESCIIGYCTALILDAATTPLPLFFPSPETFTLGVSPSSSLKANSIVLSISAVLLIVKKYGDPLQHLEKLP